MKKFSEEIPLLVILFLLYLGLPQIGINLLAITTAIIDLAIKNTDYQAQIFRSTMNSITEGQNVVA